MRKFTGRDRRYWQSSPQGADRTRRSGRRRAHARARGGHPGRDRDAAATAEPFEKGHSRAVREFYGGGDAPVPPSSDVEAEYHQPPRPATGAIGDTITLTGTNIGVRLRTTVTGLVDSAETSESPRPGMRYVGVRLRLRSTGIAIHESALQSARLRYAGGAAKPALGVKAPLLARLRRHGAPRRRPPGPRLPAVRAARERRAARARCWRSRRFPPPPAAAGGCADVERTSTCVGGKRADIVL